MTKKSIDNKKYKLFIVMSIILFISMFILPNYSMDSSNTIFLLLLSLNIVFNLFALIYTKKNNFNIWWIFLIFLIFSIIVVLLLLVILSIPGIVPVFN